MNRDRERSQEEWARLAHARIKAAHDAIIAAAADIGTPRLLETVAHLLETADGILREWFAALHPRR